MAVYDTYELISTLEEIGFFEIILPFLLVFVLIFAILEKTKILGADKEGEPKKNLNAVFSILAALLVIYQTEIAEKILEFIPKVALLAVFFIMLLLLIGIFVGAEQGWSSWLLGIGMVLALIGVIWAYWSTAYYGVEGYDIADWWYEYQGPIITIVVIIAILALALGKGKEREGGKGLREVVVKPGNGH